MFIVLQDATDMKFNIKRKANKLTAESSRYFRERDPHCNFVSHAWHDFENLKIMSVLHVNHAGKRQDAIKSCKFARCEVRFIKLDSFEVIHLLVWVHKVNCGKHVFKFCEILLQVYWFFLVGGAVASVMANTRAFGSRDRVRALASDIGLCSWARHLTLTVPFFTQMCKWVWVVFLGKTLYSHSSFLHPGV